MQPTGFICGPRLYKFEGWVFEDNQTGGPWPLKKDGELRERAGKIFYDMYSRFNKLTDKKKRECRVGGGCIPIK